MTIEDLHRWAWVVAQQPAEPNDLLQWIDGPLRTFYPFEGLVLAHGEFVAGEISVTHLLSSGHDKRYLEQIQRTFELSRRGSLQHWFASRAPLLIDARNPASWVTKFELEEMVQFSFETVAGHGVLNAKGNAGTYFGFTNVKAPLGPWHCQALRLLAPYLNSAFLLKIANEQLAATSVLAGLTFRQCEIVRSLVDGLQNKEIAKHLGISDKTVRNQLSAIYALLGIHTRTELMALLN